MLSSLLAHRALIWEFVRRDFIGKYRGSLLGVLWSLFTPLLMLLVYTTVFGEIFKSRWPDIEEGQGSFAAILFSGMIVHGFFAECLNRAPDLIVHQTSFVKKVVFPLEVLPVVLVLTALLHFCIGLSVLLIFCLFSGFTVSLSWLWIPVVMLPLILVTSGMTWFFSALGVYLRDLSQFIGLIVTVSLFLAPVFFPLTNIPDAYRNYLFCNPITLPVLELRDVMFFGRPIDWSVWSVWLGLGIIVAWAGYGWFQKVRRGFADVL